MNTIRLIPNIDIWRTSVNISSLENSTVPITIAENDILLPASIISGSQISYVINQIFS
jgi:hypothetical protein